MWLLIASYISQVMTSDFNSAGCKLCYIVLTFRSKLSQHQIKLQWKKVKELILI